MKRFRKRGFTLTELAVTAFIVSGLVVAIVAAVGTGRDVAQNNVTAADGALSQYAGLDASSSGDTGNTAVTFTATNFSTDLVSVDNGFALIAAAIAPQPFDYDQWVESTGLGTQPSVVSVPSYALAQRTDAPGGFLRSNEALLLFTGVSETGDTVSPGNTQLYWNGYGAVVVGAETGTWPTTGTIFFDTRISEDNINGANAQTIFNVVVPENLRNPGASMTITLFDGTELTWVVVSN